MADLEKDSSLENATKRAPINSVWSHKTFGGTYKITGHHEGADEYETGTPLAVRISYIQLEDGTIRKAGSLYSRTSENFFQNFEKTSEDEISLPKVP
jgi:hypothetical protein